MDLTTLMSALLSDNSVSAVSEKTGVSSAQVASVMAAALPALLNGANQQAEQQETTESFHQAVTEHAERKPEEVDAEEGAKIVNHLLGEEEAEKTEKAIAKATGLSKKKVALVLALAAPMIMNMLGKQTTSSNSTSANATASILSALLGGNSGSSASNALMTAAMTSVLTSALTGNSSSNASSSILGSVLGNALGSNNTSVASNNDMLSSLIGSALLGGATQQQHQQQSASSSTASLLNGLIGLLK